MCGNWDGAAHGGAAVWEGGEAPRAFLAAAIEGHCVILSEALYVCFATRLEGNASGTNETLKSGCRGQESARGGLC